MASPESNGQDVQNKRKRRKEFTNRRKRLHIQNVPTAEELNELQEADTTFHSNLFKMQVFCQNFLFIFLSVGIGSALFFKIARMVYLFSYN